MPITGSFCARAASGHAAAPPTSVMNSRRLMRSPQSEDHTLPQRCKECRVVHHNKIGRRLQRWVSRDRGGRSHTIVHVRFAPKATVADQNVIGRYVPPLAVMRPNLSNADLSGSLASRRTRGPVRGAIVDVG